MPEQLFTHPASEFKDGKPKNIEALVEQYGSKVIFLKEEDRELTLNDLMEKYQLSKSTTWRMMGRGYAISGYHDKNYKPDYEWCNQNVDRIQRLAKAAYYQLTREYPDIFYPLGSDRVIMPGVSPEDMVSEAILEIIGKAGSNSLNKKSNVPGTQEQTTRDIDAYLFGVARYQIMDKANVQPGYKRDREVPYYENNDEKFADNK